MTSRPARGGTSRWLALEAVTTGLAYGAGLCWASVCLVGSFRPGNLSAPYWSSLPTVRTDNTGIVAFFVVAVCFCTSEYLRLRRRRDTAATPGPAASNGTAWPLLQAASRTVAILATGLVIYLSVNAVTHPATLEIHVTHLATWPTEGTLRVIALLLCICSIAVLRYLRARDSVSQSALAT